MTKWAKIWIGARITILSENLYFGTHPDIGNVEGGLMDQIHHISRNHHFNRILELDQRRDFGNGKWSKITIRAKDNDFS